MVTAGQAVVVGEHDGSWDDVGVASRRLRRRGLRHDWRRWRQWGQEGSRGVREGFERGHRSITEEGHRNC